MGWKVSPGWRSFSHFRDFSIFLAFSPRCSSVFLAGTTMQWFSSWDEASSSMYLRDVSSTELSHLDEEAAYISCMTWRGFTTLLHKGVAAAKVEAMQMWWWRGGAHGWRQRLWRAGQGCMCDIFVAMTLLGRQPESSSVHAIAVSHFFIKMCELITWYFSWMHGRFCFTTARKSLHCCSCKRYTWASWTECLKDRNVSDMKERSLTMTCCPFHLLSLWPGTCNIISTGHGMHHFPNFQQKTKAEFHPYKMSFKYQKE